MQPSIGPAGWQIAVWLVYGSAWFILSLYGLHRGWMVFQYYRRYRQPTPSPWLPEELPRVLVQLPLYNERYVAPRLIRAMTALDYPREKLEIQVLDDSTDDTSPVIERLVEIYRAEGFRIQHVRRGSREGYKAGALEYGLQLSDAPLVAIFDADFVPRPDFLRVTVPHFNDPGVGMVQTRWEHLNRDWSLLTRAQGILLDGHFIIEHTARNRSGVFFNFNGTAGIWRRRAIQQAGGWQHDTVTEDLDLSYRAQVLGWRFVFLRDYSTPGELPVNIEDFKVQQYRWSKGAMQTCRKLLRHVLGAPITPRQKFEGGFHLLANLCYPMTVVMALMMGPMIVLRNEIAWRVPVWIDMPLMGYVSVAIFLFYFLSQVTLGRNSLKTLLLMPAVLALGLGMALNNAWATVEGLFARGGEFVRTPKYSLTDHAEEAALPSANPLLPAGTAPAAVAASRRPVFAYSVCRRSILPWLELAMSAYMGAIVVYCVLNALWIPIPFTALFSFGFGYVGAQSLMLRWTQARAAGEALAQA